MSTHYDAIIIGSGQGGTPLSMAFANAQHKTALIESSHVGGCCVNEGCTPTKTMVASGRVGYLARRGPQYGIFTGDETDSTENDIKVRMKVVRQRKRDIVDQFRSGSESRIREAGVNLIFGTACFKDERTVHVRTMDGPEMNLTADRVFICSGERPAIPKIDGLDVAAFPPSILLDSTTIQELGVVPSHLVVIGGGYIGLEFGQLFRRLGAAVTVVQRGAQLLPREDTDVAEAMLGVLKEDGVRVLLNATPTSIRPAGDGDSTAASAVLVTVSGQGSLSELQASHVLFAAGRVPNTEMLNLGAASIETTARGHIITDAQLRTTNRHVWALGDVKGGPAFTHVSYDDFRLLRTNLLEQGNLTVAERLVPYVVYTDPQLGHVGLHEHEARKQYPSRRLQVASMPMSYVARALETAEARGLMKAIVDSESQRILGFTCLGIEGGEIMSVVEMAMIGGVKWTALRDAIWAHPSLAESLNNVWNFLK
ncbi:Pyruvate/2-oxoglutarate dehydrogenase [Trichoderma reesei QM6a]|uniref:Pyruvate/2-oxoglutarate dehydrogenase n=2 Tax=Hypocrea jecorina TaxID=51453 RepID=G0RT40_HYPJQ|nr:Pyruvate/2-oxoglutarate dehydrogenase [Trichoderma reesei QM6a]EGR45798.1 Pyruvate/2-oxoglutarate dehydrogenase [Trichoderma reesei QM6a]ETS01957.1 FAD/NAD(P)-binding domain-containing protein [Trichoderma reesei RUT C-30]